MQAFCECHKLFLAAFREYEEWTLASKGQVAVSIGEGSFSVEQHRPQIYNNLLSRETTSFVLVEEYMNRMFLLFSWFIRFVCMRIHKVDGFFSILHVGRDYPR